MLDTRQVAALLQEYGERSALRGGNPYRARAYRRAAENLVTLTEPLAEIIENDQLRSIPGVGHAIADIITTLAHKGTHPSLEKLRRETPAGLLAIAAIPGLRTDQIVKLRNLLGIKTISQLEQAVREGRVAKQKGLGAALERKILNGLAIKKQSAGKRHIHRAALLLEAAKQRIERGRLELSRVTVAGDLRRGCELIGNMALVAVGPVKKVESVASGGDITLLISPAERFGAALLFGTGSAAHLEQLRDRAAAKKLALTENGLMSGKKTIAARTEREIYAALGLQYIEPELREGEAEIALAAKRRLPKLVSDTDIRGILHVHTDQSDGTNTLEEMTQGAVDRGYQYLGLSDHSKSAHYAGGLSLEQIKAQAREVVRLNRRYGNKAFRIFHGIESDILADGSLDYPPSILREFDFVIASVHSQFRKDRKSQTGRIVKAVLNPYTTILGHMTGRQLLRRPGYEADVEEILKACARRGVVVEINANPWRLDIDWRWHRLALELGCMMSINPDAHSVGEIDLTHWGVEMARKGGVPKERVLNCLPLDEFARYLQRGRNNKPPTASRTISGRKWR
jgi:DNA polymerase (family 10)